MCFKICLGNKGSITTPNGITECNLTNISFNIIIVITNKKCIINKYTNNKNLIIL